MHFMPAPLIIIHSLGQVPSLSALASLRCERLGLNYLQSLFQDRYLQMFSFSVLYPHLIINCRVILTLDFIIWAPAMNGESWAGVSEMDRSHLGYTVKFITLKSEYASCSGRVFSKEQNDLMFFSSKWVISQKLQSFSLYN